MKQTGQYESAPQKRYHFKNWSSLCFTLFLFCFTVTQIHAQDAVVPSPGDTIHCHINKIAHGVILYSRIDPYSGKIIEAAIPETKVVFYKTGLYPNESIPIGMFNDHDKFRLAFQGGLSWRTATINPNTYQIVQKYQKDLNSGYVLGLSGAIFFNKSLGVGVFGDHFLTSATLNNVVVQYTNGTRVAGSVSDHINIDDVGVLFYGRQKFLNGDAIITRLGLAELFYREHYNLVGTPTYYAGKTLGFSFGFGYDREISSGFAIGILAGISTGTLKSVNVTSNGTTKMVDLPASAYEDLTRIDLTLGIRFK